MLLVPGADGDGSHGPHHSSPGSADPSGPVRRGRLAVSLTLGFLVLLVAGGGLAWGLRHRPAHRKTARAIIAERQLREAAGRRREPPGSIEERFQELRQQILRDSFASAQDGFAGLTRRSGLTRPQGDWVRLHLIMASLLNQDPDNAQAVAEAEVRAGPFSQTEANRPLADSLDAMARAFGKPAQAVPANMAGRFKPEGPEALAPLLFGLKDLELGVTDDARRFLQAFVDTKPTGPYQWIADYRPLAVERARELGILAGLRERLRHADTPEKQNVLLAEFDRSRDQIQTSRIIELFDSSAGILRQQLSATRQEEAGGLLAREAAQNDLDKARWQAVRETAQSAVRLFRYEEALATLRGLSELKGADFIAARDALMERTTRLASFKRQLIADLNAGAGRDQPLPVRNGTVYPQGIVRADPGGLRVATPGGEVPLVWTDVPPHALVQLAGRIASARAAADATTPGVAAERRWLAAAYAREVSLFPEARALAEQAARDQPELRAKLGQFP